MIGRWPAPPPITSREQFIHLWEERLALSFIILNVGADVAGESLVERRAKLKMDLYGPLGRRHAYLMVERISKIEKVGT